MGKSNSTSSSFVDRVKGRTSRTTQSCTVVETENDFPFENVDFVRVGSAHTVCEPSQDDANTDLLIRLSTHIMSRYEADLLPAKVVIEYKSDSGHTLTSTDVKTIATDASYATSSCDHFQPSFIDRRWLKELYACVLFMGQLAGQHPGQHRSGSRGYCISGFSLIRLSTSSIAISPIVLSIPSSSRRSSSLVPRAIQPLRSANSCA